MNDSAVREELERVLGSPGLAHAGRISRCLRYLIEETLAGRQDAIKEYTIGVEIYGRGPDYDPKIDAIVRVEARRLRAKLKQYYDGAGCSDPVRIELPRGSYVPVFHNGSSSPEAGEAAHAVSARRVALAGGLTALAALALWAGVRLIRGGAGQALSLAVQPLANLSGDAETGHLASGLTQQLANTLTAEEGFSLITRTGRTRAVLEGGVQRAGDQVRVLLRLIRARDGYQAWSATYDSLPGAQTPFADAVCLLVRRTLQAQFAGDPARLENDLSVPRPEAMSLYVRGREAWTTQRRPGVEESAACFRQAIARDPRFAKAYEGLAASELFLCDLDPAHAGEHLAAAREAAQQAIALDEHLADAHARLGNIYLRQDWNFTSAEHELARALVLNPGRSEVSLWYARAARLRRHAGDALHELEFGAVANSSSEVILTELGMFHYEAGETAAAWQMQALALKAAPYYRPAHLLAGLLHEDAGKLDDAAREFASCADATSNGIVCQAALGHVRGLAGQSAEARRIARSLPELRLAALVYAGLNDREQTLRALEQSFARHELMLPWISFDPRFRRLRGEARYQELLRRMGV